MKLLLTFVESTDASQREVQIESLAAFGNGGSLQSRDFCSDSALLLIKICKVKMSFECKSWYRWIMTMQLGSLK